MTTTETVLSIAKKYIDNGFSILPINGKAPRIPQWQNSSLDFEAFQANYTEGDNIGVLTGNKNCLICIDIDVKNGGMIWYETFKDDLGSPLKEVTSTGGLHLYYKYPNDTLYVKSIIGYQPGVDILADGGRQVVTYPSKGINGESYVIEDFKTLLDVLEHDSLPDWLLSELKGEKPETLEVFESPTEDPSFWAIECAVDVLKSLEPAIQGRAGDTKTFAAACRMRDYGLTQKTAFELLKLHYNPMCRPMWSDRELMSKVTNAYKYAKTAPGLELPQNQFKLEDAKTSGKLQDNVESFPPTFVEKKTSQFKPLGINEFLSKSFAKKEHYLGPFVQQGITLVYAATGVGKTHFAMGVAFAIASGGDFLKWKCEKKARVLYVDGELPGHYIQGMVAPLYKAAKDKDIVFNVLTPDALEDGMMPDLGTPEGQRMLEPAIADVDLVVIDNLSTLVRSGEENAAAYWEKIQPWFLKLRRQGKSVIFIHHAGKGENGSFRGTSKMTDATDLAVHLKAPAGHKAEDGCVFEVKFPKFRHYRKGDAEEFRASYINTEFSDPHWECEGLEKLNSNSIKDMFESGMSQREISEALDVSKQYVSKKIKDLGLSKEDMRTVKVRRRADFDDAF